MKTAQLIDALAQGNAAVPRGTAMRRMIGAAALGLLLSVVITALLFGFRPDLLNAWHVVALKGLYALLAAAAAAPLLIELSRPSIRIGRFALPAIGFVIVSTLLALAAYVFTPESLRMMEWMGGGIPECLYRIPLLASPVAVALTLAVRSLGPTRLTLAGGAIGGVSGALGGIVYSICCPMDSVLYVASWYLFAILFCAGVGAVVIGRFLRW